MAFLFLISGCSFNRAGGALLENLFTDIQYRRDGFFIMSPEKEFLFSLKKNQEVLKIQDEQLNRITLIDQFCDQKIDEIVLNDKSRYLRGDDKTKSLFDRADEIFKRYRGYLGVEGAKKKWKSLSPLDISGSNGLGNI